MTKLTKPIKRVVNLHGLSEPVCLHINPGGLEMSVSGAKKHIFASWEHIARHLLTGGDVPSFLFDKPWEFLEYQNLGAKARRNGREPKK